MCPSPEKRSSWPSVLASIERLPAAIRQIDIRKRGGAIQSPGRQGRRPQASRLEGPLIDEIAD